MSALGRFVLNFDEKHPGKAAVVIDYEVVSIMMPCQLIGAQFGVNLNQIMPDFLTLILLSLILVY